MQIFSVFSCYCAVLLLVPVTAFVPLALPETGKPGGPLSRRRNSDDLLRLSAYRSNSYLVALEKQTMEAAGTTPSRERGEEENLSKTQQLMKQVKEAGTAGVISYALWELGFWMLSIPVVLFGYVQFTGHFPDFANKDDMSKLGAGTCTALVFPKRREHVCLTQLVCLFCVAFEEAFAFVNFARFAVPLRIGLALSTAPWIQENVLDRFFAKVEKF